MTFKNKKKTLSSLEEKCAAEGVKLTSKKMDIFEALLDGKKAMSAYAIAEALKKKKRNPTPVMSIYRALDFFMERDVVHKISSLNLYSVCAHISCEHHHEMPRLAICVDCHKVDEKASNNSIKKALETGLDPIDFEMQSEQLELLGLCRNCSGKASSL